MQCHESQQSASIIATIAIIIGNKINNEVFNINEEYHTIEKLETWEEFRMDELMKVLNKQYANVCLENSNRIRLNSVVLVRNIANETKRELLKIARIEKIHESRDSVQRVVTLTYHNVSKNKSGKWIGTPVRVERSVNDLILVDDALSESMLNPNIQKIWVRNYSDETENDKIEQEENQSIELMNNNDGNDETIRD